MKKAMDWLFEGSPAPIIAIFFLVLLLGIGGCAGSQISENDKQLNYQNLNAGKLIEEKAPGEFKQVGNDIKLNSEQLGKVIGEPKEKKEYSPNVSKQSRDESKKEHSPLGKYGILASVIFFGTQALKFLLPKLIPLAVRFLPLGGLTGTILDVIMKNNSLFAPAIGLATGGVEGGLAGAVLANIFKAGKDNGANGFLGNLVDRVFAVFRKPKG